MHIQNFMAQLDSETGLSNTILNYFLEIKTAHLQLAAQNRPTKILVISL